MVKIGPFGLHRKRAPQRALPPPSQVDFIAFDVETANTTRGSICAIGVALVRDGQVVEVGSTLVNPECEFNGYNIAVNGIGPSDVLDAPTIRQVWPQLYALLDGQRVVAHYASFDVGALRAAAAQAELVGPSFELYCTYRLGRRVWQTLPSHGLGYLGPALGIEFDHHEAGGDAYACARIALEACAASGVSSLDALAAEIGFMPAKLTSDSYIPAHFIYDGAHSPSLRNRDGDAAADPDHPLYDKNICFTGGMFAMTRAEASAAIVHVGANFRNNVSKKTDYLVIGDVDFVAFADGWKTGKLTKALELREERDAPIEIIAERDFLALLSS
jgi:DNA polymerase-3 subunit epsilon